MAGVVVVLVSGSLRPGSSNTAVLQAVAGLAPPGVDARLLEGLREVPAFVPGDGDPPAAAADVLAQLDAAHAVLFSTPEYAGGLPGSLKNLLDWTVGGGQLHGKPVGWVDVAYPGRGTGARAQLASVLGYVDADVVEEACTHVALEHSGAAPAVTAEGRAGLAGALAALAARVRDPRPSPSVVQRLVRLRPGDAGEVLTLQRAAYVTEAQAHHDLDLPPLRQDLASVVTELGDPGVLALGRRDAGGRLLAAVRARLTTADGATAEIGRLAVVPDRQGQGLGTGLLEALEDELPAGVTELRLFTGEYSSANLRLYARLGYSQTGREVTPAGYDLVHLSKRRRKRSDP